MNKTFGQHIITLLKEHECVVVPNIGGILLKNKPAHLSNGQIYPASKTIEFNKNILNEDDLLVSELVNKESLTFLEAKSFINKFSSDISYSLNQSGFYDIEDLGRFTLSENKNIRFTPLSNIENLDKDNFGLNSLHIFSVSREIIRPTIGKKIIQVEEKIEEPIVEPTKKTLKIEVYGLVATLVLIFGIFSLLVSNTEVKGLKVQNAGVLNFFVAKSSSSKKQYTDIRVYQQDKASKKNKKKKKKSKKQITVENLDTTMYIKDENPSDLTTFTENVEKEKVIVEEESIYLKDLYKVKTENPNGYYIVIGAYGSLSNANKVKYECSVENNVCKLFKTDSGLYRVAIYISKDANEAVVALEDFKQKNASYWLLKNN